MTFNRFAGLGTLHALRTLVFARAPLGCDVSRAGNGMSAMRVLRFASAARAGSVSRPSSLWRPTKCVWMFGRRPGAPCSDTANTSVPWKEVENATAVIWKTLLIAEKTFRRLDAPELLADVASGVVYVNGVRAVNQRERKAAA